MVSAEQTSLLKAEPDWSSEVSASTILMSNHRRTTFILFCVKVPILSDQMVEVNPRFSTAYKFSTC